MPRLNENYQKLPGAYLFAEVGARIRASQAARPGDEIIRMGIGDVTRPLPPIVAEAFAKAAAGMATPEGFHGYGPDYGYDFLRDAVIARDYAPYGAPIDRDEVFVSDGAKSDTSALQELFAPDARVAVTDPVYPVYIDSNAMAGRAGDFVDGRWSRVEYLPCTLSNGFMPPLPQTAPDVVYLCYPNNPTGTTLTRAQLKLFVDWARASGALIVYDAAYKAFVQSQDVPATIYEIEGANECCVECCSFSKTAGFTGVRCAYTVIPRAVAGGRLHAMWKRRMGSCFNGVSYPVQRAAEAAYSDAGYAQCMEGVAYYRENARVLLASLKRAGVPVFGGVDAPYVWLRVPGGLDSWAFFDLLLDKARVAGTPGAGFGPSGEGYFRLTAFSTHADTRRAAERLEALLKEESLWSRRS